MKKSSYWLAGALAVLAALAVFAFVQRRDAAPRLTSAPPPSMPTPMPDASASPLPVQHYEAPHSGESPDPTPAPDRSIPRDATPTPTPSSSPGAEVKYYRCPTCGMMIARDPNLVGTRMLTCWNCSTVFYADDKMMPLDPAHVPQPSATPAASDPPEGIDRSIAPPKHHDASSAAADPLAAVDAMLQKMDWGQMAFDVPEHLRKDQTALIHLIVSPTASGEQLTATLRAEATEPVRIEPAQIQISDLMEARLVGSAFDIQPITPEEPQMVGRAQPTEWKWEIHPRQTGRQSLHLTLNAIVRYKEEKTSHPVRTFDKVIEVEVAAAPSFYERFGHWLLPAAGLVVLAGAAAGFFLRRKRRPGALPTPAAAPVRPADGVELFVSYSRRDEERALALVGRLQAMGYKAWIDQRGIEGATLWAQEISEAIRRSRACVLFASAASFGSANVARELSLVCEEGKPILPLFLEPAEVPSALRFQLAGIQQIELFRGEAEENFQKVLRALDRLGVARPVTEGK